MGRSYHRYLVRSDRETQGFKGRKLGSRGPGSAQHDRCACYREQFLHDNPPLFGSPYSQFGFAVILPPVGRREV